MSGHSSWHIAGRAQPWGLATAARGPAVPPSLPHCQLQSLLASCLDNHGLSPGPLGAIGGECCSAEAMKQGSCPAQLGQARS